MRPIFGSNVLGSTWRDDLEANAEEMWGELDSNEDNPESYNAVFQGGNQVNYTDTNLSEDVGEEPEYMNTNIVSTTEAPTWWLNLAAESDLGTWQQFLQVLERDGISLDLFENYMEGRNSYEDFDLMHIDFFELDDVDSAELSLLLDNINTFASVGVKKPAEYYGNTNNNQTSGGSGQMPPRYMDDSLPGGGSDTPPTSPSIPPSNNTPKTPVKTSAKGMGTKKKVLLFGGVALVGALAYKIIKN